MKAYLIDPEARAVIETEYPGDSGIAPLIDSERGGIDRIEFGNDRDAVWIGGEVFLSRGALVWNFAAYPFPLAGKALVLGCNSIGESCEPRISLAQLEEMISWTELETSGEMGADREAPGVYIIGDPILRPLETARFKVPTRASFTFECRGPFVKIEDVSEGAQLSVTNDAAAVVAAIRSFGVPTENRFLLYRDTEGCWDGIVCDTLGAFQGFYPLQASSFGIAEMIVRQRFIPDQPASALFAGRA